MSTKSLTTPVAPVLASTQPLSGTLMIAAGLAALFALAVLAAQLAAGDDGLVIGHLRDLLPGDPRAWSALTA